MLMLAVIGLLVWAPYPGSNAQQEPNRQLVQPGSANTTTGKRLALVIGNSAYPNAPLKNPVNDAQDIAAALRALGFEVISRENVNQNDMKRAIREFGEKIRGAAVGLFYYAGHGVQVNGENYLVPVDAKVESEQEVEYECVKAGFVLAQMDAARNSMNIVILDACRNNPFVRSFRSESKGLAQMDAPSGTLIAYATAPGSVASDGAGRNGLYTQELLKQMRTSGLGIEDVFKRVRISVRAATQQKQTPWESSSLVGDFYFSGSTAAKAAPPISNSGDNKPNEPASAAKTSSPAAKSFKSQQGIEMVYVPPGRFMMGSNGLDRERPVHEVTISQPFYMGKYEVTQAQWQAVMGNNPSSFKGGSLPVDSVSWDNAIAFLARLNAQNDGYSYRLPTEAEWEYACRAGTTGDYAGDLDAMAWFGNNSGRGRLDAAEIMRTDSANYQKRITENGGQTHPVGSKLPNSFGLFDMHGNVWEWCQDWFHANYEGAPNDGSAWLSGGEQRFRVVRAGSWQDDATLLGSAYRYGIVPNFGANSGLGFRVVAVVRAP
jgi:formylglycine-generating enzyme required for sulfatase activity